ncbi:MAG: hypothetical protein LBG77_08915 [Dysgonamonadaceae bacterium]|jgi:hypothetical protein|nr:hypothetical protein [Dysgonamonadaceae bacterium]
MQQPIFAKTKNCNDNYASRIVKIDNIRKHPNADKLQITTIDGGNVIVGLDVKEGDIMVYCPVESALCHGFLSTNNLYEDKEKNIDPAIKGFFNKHGRVRAINLRGEPSRGFVFPVEHLSKWQPELSFPNPEEFIGQEFDSVNGLAFSRKYIPFVQKSRSQKASERQNNRRNKHLQKFDRLVENQFKFHIDTASFAKFIHNIQPDDLIQITAKWHGTSSISACILVNRQLNFWEKCLKKLGVKIIDKEYGDVVASRTVIKNRFINKNMADSFYEVDVWNTAHQKLLPFLEKGMTLYYEIVGYLPDTNTFIQKNHDYGCLPGEFAIRIYRITFTNPAGAIFEFSAKQVQDWCKSRGLDAVKELYYGKAKDIYPDLDTQKHWHENFLLRLQNDQERFYMELDEPDCQNPVPFEGLVIRKERLGLEVYKLKTNRHYIFETLELDQGELDIETAQSLPEENDNEA